MNATFQGKSLVFVPVLGEHNLYLGGSGLKSKWYALCSKYFTMFSDIAGMKSFKKSKTHLNMLRSIVFRMYEVKAGPFY